MSVTSPPDILKARGAKHIICEPVLELAPLQSVARATVAHTPAIPTTEIEVIATVDWANTGIGRAFSVEDPATGKIKVWGVQRKASNSTHFYPDVKSRGDAGIATGNAQDVAAGDTLRVYKHRPLYGYISRATAQEAFKAWDVRYDGSGAQPYPVVNFGDHHRFDADEQGVHVHTFDASASFFWWGGVTGIQAVAWTLPSGATIVTGSLTTTQVTVQLPPGRHEIKCQVTANNGQVASGYRWVFVNSRDVNSADAAFSSRHPVTEITSDEETRRGRRMTFTVRGDCRAELYPGVLCVFTYPLLYDGEAMTEGTQTGKFVGYLTDIESTGTPASNSVTVSFVSPLLYMDQVPSATQLIEETCYPADWTQVVPGLSVPAYVVFYLLFYHTPFVINHDYKPTGAMWKRRQVYGFHQTTIGSQLTFLEQMAGVQINCTAGGALLAHAIPEYGEPSQRAQLDLKYIWTERDLAGAITLTPRLRPEVASVTRDGIAFNGATVETYRSTAPGLAQLQGLSKADETDIILQVRDALGRSAQAQLDAFVGHDLAHKNNPLESVQLNATQMLDLWSPADPDWHRLDVPDSYLSFDPDRFALDWAALRFRPQAVSRAWQNIEGRGIFVFTEHCNARFETVGKPGRELTVATINNNASFKPNIVDQPVPDAMAATLAFRVNHAGRMGVSTDFNEVDPAWQSLDNGLPGRVLWACFDHAGGTPKRLYVVTWQRDDISIKLHTSSDITQAPPTWTEIWTQAVSSSFAGKLTMATYRPSRVVVAWVEHDGIHVRRVYAEAEVVPGTHPGVYVTRETEIGLTADTAFIHVSGLTEEGQYKLYFSPFDGTDWTAVDTLPAPNHSSRSPLPMIHYNEMRTFTVIDRLNTTARKEETFIFRQSNSSRLPVSDHTLVRSSADVPVDRYFAWTQATQNVLYGVQTRLIPHDARDKGQTFRLSALQFKPDIFTRYHGAEGDPPGNAGTPAFFPPSEWYRTAMVIQVTLYGTCRVLYTASREVDNLFLDDGYSIFYAPSRRNFSHVFLKTMPELNLTFDPLLDGVKSIEFSLRAKNTRNFGRGSYTSFGSHPVAVFELSIGHQQMTLVNRVNDGQRLVFTRGKAWGDITPPQGVPAHPQGLAAEGSMLVCVATHPETGRRQLVHSENNGTSWQALKHTSSYHFVRHIENGILLAGGERSLDVSSDLFVTKHNRLARWGGQLGARGTTRIADGKVVSS